MWWIRWQMFPDFGCGDLTDRQAAGDPRRQGLEAVVCQPFNRRLGPWHVEEHLQGSAFLERCPAHSRYDAAMPGYRFVFSDFPS